jgi:stage V sporulation protein D (sporulation-specific penicillin-binding protein)
MQRIYFLKLILLLFLGAILIRLFYWQFIRADELRVLAEGQHLEEKKIDALRGQILFSDGSILASNKPVYLLYGSPKVLSSEDKVKVATILARVIAEGDGEMEVKKEILDNLNKDLFWVPLRKNVDLNLKIKIDELKLTGIGFEESSSRFYPEGSSSAQLLGFVASDQRGIDTGYFGLEGFYNGELKAVAGEIRQEKDTLGLPILLGDFLSSAPKDGKTLKLNIDRAVQFTVEESLKKGMVKYGAKAASAIVMDPKTGAVLALATLPSYDPANFGSYPKETYRNPIVADSYEPGSTFKVLVMAAAVNENLVKSDTKCDICDKPVQISGFTIRTWDNKYLADASMTDVIVHSDNTGMVFTSKKIGLDKFYDYLTKYGFGNITNIDLQDEAAPEIRPKKSWGEIDLATASFGQGIAVTPIEMIKAVSSIANKGYIMEPHVVSSVGDFQIKPKVVNQVISESAAKTITEMMVKAVNEGEAKFFKPKGFKIAGKTGTAQIPVAGHYDPTKTIASFVGFAPADDPRFIMLVRYDQPSSSIFGAETAAPTFFEIAKHLFPYFKIAPSE